MSGSIIYVRVSDARQIDNTSLDSQQSMCREWCAHNGLDVKRVFVERGESAKSADRPQFQAMFRYIEGLPKGQLSHVVVYKFDRFSRDTMDGAHYRMQLRQRGLVLRSATETTDESPAGKLLSNMLSSIGQFDNDMRSERSVAGMKTRLDSGKWVWMAPVGYLSGHRNGRPMQPDPVRGPLVAKLFSLIATGHHTKASALEKVTALGLRSNAGAKLSQETIDRVVHNRLYMGEMIAKGWGKAVKGDFQPLITEETFDRVQSFLAGRALPSVAHVRDRAEFPLRGLLLCPECQRPVTASRSTGKLGGKFGYYRCHRVSGHMNVNSEVVEDAFIELLNSLTPKTQRMVLIERIFRDSWNSRIQSSAQEAIALKRELVKAEAAKKRILDQFAAGVLTAEDFTPMRKAIGETIVGLRHQLSLPEGNILDVDSAIEYLMHLLWNTSATWQTSDLIGKMRIQRRLFPDGLSWQENGRWNPATHTIYSYLADDSISESQLASPTGFEPVSSP